GEYLDTPMDLYCASTTSCPNTKAPVFFNPFKLSTVTAQVKPANASGYGTVDRWDLVQTYPPSGDFISPPGNDTNPNLWLQSLTHTGFAADSTSLTEQPMTFGGAQMFNRL